MKLVRQSDQISCFRYLDEDVKRVKKSCGNSMFYNSLFEIYIGYVLRNYRARNIDDVVPFQPDEIFGEHLEKRLKQMAQI